MYYTCSAKIARLVGMAVLGLFAGNAQSQTGTAKEKAPLYTYVADWAVPRAKWADFAKPSPANQKILDQGLSDNTLISYGDDFNLVHSAEGYTHDSWWASHTMAGVIKILDAFDKLPSASNGPLASATKHEDNVLVSRHYNWRAGTYKDAYTHGASYKLKPSAPDDAVDLLAKSVFEPLLEKLLADGTIVEYEVDEEAIHTEAPDSFWVYYVMPKAEGLDQVNEALTQTLKVNALILPAFDAIVDQTPHRDVLFSSTATFK